MYILLLYHFICVWGGNGQKWVWMTLILLILSITCLSIISNPRLAINNYLEPKERILSLVHRINYKEKRKLRHSWGLAISFNPVLTVLVSPHPHPSSVSSPCHSSVWFWVVVFALCCTCHSCRGRRSQCAAIWIPNWPWSNPYCRRQTHVAIVEPVWPRSNPYRRHRTCKVMTHHRACVAIVEPVWLRSDPYHHR